MARRHLFAISLLLSVISTLVAQSTFYTNFSPDNPGRAFGLRIADDGNFLVTGGGWGLWVMKLDNAGEIIWQNAFEGTYTRRGRAIIETRDGGLLAVGTQAKPDFQGFNLSAPYAVKTDLSGNLLWSFIWNEEVENGNQIVSVLQPDDGTYVLTGTTDLHLNIGPTHKGLLLAIDTAGNERWTKIYDDDTLIQDAVLTTEGKYCLGGSSGYFLFSTVPYLAVTDSLGETVWERSNGWEISSSGYISSVIEDEEGAIVVCGTATNTETQSDVFVSKLDMEGNLVWTRLYSNPAPDIASTIVADGHGGYTFAGYTSHETTGQFDQYDIWLVNIDNAGEVIWSRSFGTEEEDVVTDLTKCPDGGYALTGYHYSGNTGFFVKTDSLGRVDALTDYQIPSAVSVRELSIFPNPVANVLSIENASVPVVLTERVRYSIVNASGAVVQRGELGREVPASSSPATIEVETLKAGAYFIEFTLGGERYGGRFIKQ